MGQWLIPLCVLLSLVQQGITNITCHSAEQYVGETGNLTCDYLKSFNHKLSYWYRRRNQPQWKQICQCIQDGGCILTDSRSKYSCEMKPGKVFLLIYNSSLDDSGIYKFDLVAEGKSQEKEVYYVVHEQTTTFATLTVKGDKTEQNREQNESRKGRIDRKMIALVVIVVVAVLVVAVIMYMAFLRKSNTRNKNNIGQAIPLVDLPHETSEH